MDFDDAESRAPLFLVTASVDEEGPEQRSMCTSLSGTLSRHPFRNSCERVGLQTPSKIAACCREDRTLQKRRRDTSSPMFLQSVQHCGQLHGNRMNCTTPTNLLRGCNPHTRASTRSGFILRHGLHRDRQPLVEATPAYNLRVQRRHTLSHEPGPCPTPAARQFQTRHFLQHHRRGIQHQPCRPVQLSRRHRSRLPGFTRSLVQRCHRRRSQPFKQLALRPLAVSYPFREMPDCSGYFSRIQ